MKPVESCDRSQGPRQRRCLAILRCPGDERKARLRTRTRGIKAEVRRIFAPRRQAVAFNQPFDLTREEPSRSLFRISIRPVTGTDSPTRNSSTSSWDYPLALDLTPEPTLPHH